MLRTLLDKIKLPDEEAAACAIDVGRNLYRARLEVAGREAQFDELRTFQKLIYVSTQLFGELKAQYLTPWVARFGVTPEQVSVAKRNGAKTVMQGRIAAQFDGKIPAEAEALKKLREMQLDVKLPDADCSALVKELIAAEVRTSRPQKYLLQSSLLADLAATPGARRLMSWRLISTVGTVAALLYHTVIHRQRCFIERMRRRVYKCTELAHEHLRYTVRAGARRSD
jgi:hypothetical protein